VGKPIINHQIKGVPQMGTSVNYRETLVTYLTSETVEEAARNLGIGVPVLKSRIATLRDHGVKVPAKTVSQWSDFNVAQLNALVKKHTQKSN
jgi:hypothetical protein